MNPQILNSLRLASQLVDTELTGVIKGKNFKRIYRQVNLRMNLNDEKEFFDFMAISGGETKVTLIPELDSNDLSLSIEPKSFNERPKTIKG